MKRIAAAFLAASFAASACSLFSPAPTLVVPLDISWDGDFAALVYDSTGLVTGGRSLGLGPGAVPSETAVARPEQNEIDIAWTGGACSHRPTVTLSGTAQSMLISVANPDDPNFLPFLPVGCPAVGLFAGVTLTLSAPVLQEDVDLEIVR